MKVTEIVVSAGRVVNHPYESYSNLRPSITLKASLDEGENFEQATRLLQARAEQLVEDHKNNMLQSIEELHRLTERQREVAGLESGIRKAQQKLDQVRAEYPQLQLGKGSGESGLNEGEGFSNDFESEE